MTDHTPDRTPDRNDRETPEDVVRRQLGLAVDELRAGPPPHLSIRAEARALVRRRRGRQVAVVAAAAAAAVVVGVAAVGARQQGGGGRLDVDGPADTAVVADASLLALDGSWNVRIVGDGTPGLVATFDEDEVAATNGCVDAYAPFRVDDGAVTIGPTFMTPEPGCAGGPLPGVLVRASRVTLPDPADPDTRHLRSADGEVLAVLTRRADLDPDARAEPTPRVADDLDGSWDVRIVGDDTPDLVATFDGRRVIATYGCVLAYGRYVLREDTISLSGFESDQPGCAAGPLPGLLERVRTATVTDPDDPDDPETRDLRSADGEVIAVLTRRSTD